MPVIIVALFCVLDFSEQTLIVTFFYSFQRRDDARQFMKFLHPDLGIGNIFQSSLLYMSDRSY